jgi:hypothetical protein
MAKAKEPSKAPEKLVETAQDNDFADAEPEQLPPRGSDLESEIERDSHGPSGRPRRPRPGDEPRRKVTNYHDAERLHNLVKAGHTHLATPDEIVDWEEAELLPNPAHFATGSSAAALGLPPDEPV